MKKYLAAFALSVITAFNAALTYRSYSDSKAPKVVVERQVERTVERELIIDVKKHDLDKQMAVELIKSTVKVETRTSFGTGVILFSGQCQDVSKDSHYYTYIVTCAHVVHDSKKVQVRQFSYLDNREIVDEISSRGTVLLTDESRDLAIIEMKSNRKIGRAVSMVTKEDYQKMVVDDPIFAVGCPLGYPPYITRGNVACFDVPDHYGTPGNHIMISAPVMFGNSGGGAYTVDGKLLGIVRLLGGSPDGHIYNSAGFIVPVWVLDSWLRASEFGFILGEKDSSIEKMHEARAQEQKTQEELEKLFKSFPH